MKKIVVLFLAVLSLGVVSCSSDDDSGGTIEGRWYVNKTGTNFGGQEILIDHEHECATQKDYMEFLSNAVLRTVDHDDDCQAYTDEGTWEKNGNQLVITEDGEEIIVNILKLSKSELKLSFSFEGISIITVFRRS